MKVINLLREDGYLKIALVGLEDTPSPSTAPSSYAARALGHAVTFAPPVSARALAGGAHTLRWLAAAALTLLAHTAVVLAVVGWRSAAVAPSEPPRSRIDLSPVAPSSTAPEQNMADGPQMTEATPSPSDRVAEQTPAAAPNPNPLAPEAPAETPAPERPAAVENPAIRPEPPAQANADSKPQPTQPMETQVPPVPQPPAPAVQDLALPQSAAQEAEPPPPAQPPPETKLPAASASTPAPASPPAVDARHRGACSAGQNQSLWSPSRNLPRRRR